MTQTSQSKSVGDFRKISDIPSYLLLPDFGTLTLKPTTNILSLPLELHATIITHLDAPTAQLLRQTNRYFASLIPPLSTLSALLAAEQCPTAHEANIFACAVCLRLRCAGKFSDAFRKGHRWGREGAGREKRFCIDCGMRSKGGDPALRYKKGESWTRFGMVYVKCKICFMKKRQVKERAASRVCPGCWGSGRR